MGEGGDVPSRGREGCGGRLWELPEPGLDSEMGTGVRGGTGGGAGSQEVTFSDLCLKRTLWLLSELSRGD